MKYLHKDISQLTYFLDRDLKKFKNSIYRIPYPKSDSDFLHYLHDDYQFTYACPGCKEPYHCLAPEMTPGRIVKWYRVRKNCGLAKCRVDYLTPVLSNLLKKRDFYTRMCSETNLLRKFIYCLHFLRLSLMIRLRVLFSFPRFGR